MKKRNERVRTEMELAAEAQLKNAERRYKREFHRRDVWTTTAAQVRREAQGRPVWVIQCPAPDSMARFHGGKYGDYAYCLNIQKHLEAAGCYVVLNCYEDWNMPIDADVVLVIRGVHAFRPVRRNPKTKFILWMTSHPELIQEGECDLYDLVLVDAEPFAAQLQKQTTTPIRPFYVLTDTELFYAAPDEDIRYDHVFIGNTRGILRGCVKWCHDNQIEADVWGAEWEKFYPDSPYLHLHGQIAYEKIADIYRHSRIIINNHYDEMLEVGMLNNRFPEVLLCGKPMVCDWSPTFEEQFGDMVLFYRNEKEFVECMRRADAEYDMLRARIMERMPELIQQFKFENGIRRMQVIISGLE